MESVYLDIYVLLYHCNPASQQQQMQVEVRTISDIEKECALVRTKLSLLRREPAIATQICSEHTH